MKKILIILLLATFSSWACDGVKGVNAPLNFSLTSNQTQTETFDYTDCSYGIYNLEINVFWSKYSKNIEVHLYDLTTNVEYIHFQPGNNGLVYYQIANGDRMTGHILQLVITNHDKKVSNISVRVIPCFCGP